MNKRTTDIQGRLPNQEGKKCFILYYSYFQQPPLSALHTKKKNVAIGAKEHTLPAYCVERLI
jgi:hypothetical protein